MNGNTPERHIEFEGCQNFRDLGGYRTSDGRATRWRTLFRSGDPSMMTPADMDRARALAISAVLDFRSSAHSSLQTGPLSREVRRYHPLALEPQWVDPDHRGTWLDMSLACLANSSAQAQLRAGIEALAGDAGLPAVFHCAQGKDRTGLFAAVVLGCLGVDDSDIAADFALSAQYFDKEKLTIALRAVAELGPAGAELAKRAAQLATLFPAGNETPALEPMLAFLDRVRSGHGSMRAYVLGIGVDEECLGRLEEKLLEMESGGTDPPIGTPRQTPGKEKGDMTDNSPESVVLRALGLFDGSREGTDRCLEMFAESAVWEFAPTTESPRWRRVEGKEAARALYYRVYDQSRGVSSTIHEVVTEGDTVVVTYTFSGTVSADVPGFPAGSRRNFEAVNLYKVSDGLIVRYVQYTGPPVLAEPAKEELP